MFDDNDVRNISGNELTLLCRQICWQYNLQNTLKCLSSNLHVPCHIVVITGVVTTNVEIFSLSEADLLII